MGVVNILFELTVIVVAVNEFRDKRIIPTVEVCEHLIEKSEIRISKDFFFYISQHYMMQLVTYNIIDNHSKNSQFLYNRYPKYHKRIKFTQLAKKQTAIAKMSGNNEDVIECEKISSGEILDRNCPIFSITITNKNMFQCSI